MNACEPLILSFLLPCDVVSLDCSGPASGNGSVFRGLNERKHGRSDRTNAYFLPPAVAGYVAEALRAGCSTRNPPGVADPFSCLPNARARLWRSQVLGTLRAPPDCPRSRKVIRVNQADPAAQNKGRNATSA